MQATQWRLGLCGLVLVVSAAGAWAIPVERIPNPQQSGDSWVSDEANILQPETEARLNALIGGLQATNGSEMAVVTVPDSKPAASTKELATQLFNTWKIGQRGKDHGLFVPILVGDRRVEIETDFGVEALLPDAKVGHFDAGILAGTESLVQIPRGQPVNREAETIDTSWQIWFAAGMAGAALWAWIIFQVRSARIDVNQALLDPLKGLAGLAVVRGLGQSVKLNPRQSSRVGDWRLHFETMGALRCRPAENAASELGSLRVVGWRCRHCAPREMHLGGDLSPSVSFDRCPQDQGAHRGEGSAYHACQPHPARCRSAHHQHARRSPGWWERPRIGELRWWG